VTEEQQFESGLPEVMRIVGRLYRRAIRTLDRDGTGLSVGTRAVLELLAHSDSQPVPRIAEKLVLSRQFVQRSVDAGVDAGVLELAPNPAHRRSSLVCLTQAGRNVIGQITAREQHLLEFAGRELTEEEVATCIRVLRLVYSETEWTIPDSPDT
jgi:DNA-binding MarR family transcriptional regulator